MDRNYFDLSGQVALVTGCSGDLGVQMAEAPAAWRSARRSRTGSPRGSA